MSESGRKLDHVPVFRFPGPLETFAPAIRETIVFRHNGGLIKDHLQTSQYDSVVMV